LFKKQKTQIKKEKEKKEKLKIAFVENDEIEVIKKRR